MRNKKRQTANTTLIDKLLAKKGPVTLTRPEVQQLAAAFLDIGQTNLQLYRDMSGIAETLKRHNLQHSFDKLLAKKGAGDVEAVNDIETPRVE